MQELAPWLVEASRIIRHVHRDTSVHRRVGASCCSECRYLASYLSMRRDLDAGRMASESERSAQRDPRKEGGGG